MKKSIFLVILAVVLGLVIGCPNDTPTPEPTPTPLETVAVPTVMYNNIALTDNSEIDFSVRLELRSATAYATVHYKFSGQTNYSEIENGATVVIPEGSTSITVKATKDGLTDSSEKTIHFSMGTVAYPVIETLGGRYNEGALEIRISVPTGASVYYTDDGGEPSEDSTPYTGPFDITISKTAVEVKAIAIKTGLINSGVVRAEYKHNGLPVAMVNIQGGTFARDNDGAGSGTATTNITISDFMLGETEVTQAQWLTVMGSAFPDPKFSFDMGAGENHPMYHVTWYDAIEFCNALSEDEGLKAYYVIDKTNQDDSNNNDRDTLKWTVTINEGADGYRLPTEAEWEYAAGGGARSKRTSYAGTDTDADLGDYAWYGENDNSTTHIVGTTGSSTPDNAKTGKYNGLGLYDMSGNVFEWCWDWYVDPYDTSVKDNPTGAATGSFRVRRGGSWSSGSSSLRVDYRGSSPSTYRGNDFGGIGFRVARNAN